jgi:hypothetical protein
MYDTRVFTEKIMSRLDPLWRMTPELLWIGDFIGGHEPRPDQNKRISRLALCILTTAFGLERAIAEVINDAVACDVREGFVFCEIACLIAEPRRAQLPNV